MPVPQGLYQQVRDELERTAGPARLKHAGPRLARLAWLVTGMVAARSAVVAEVARELEALYSAPVAAGPPGEAMADGRRAFAKTPRAASWERRLRRALADPGLSYADCYAPALARLIDWGAALGGRKWVAVVIDESSKADRVHLFRASLARAGGALPLAWAVWERNAPLGEGEYWAWVDRVLAALARVLPPGVEVVVLADRAYDNAEFTDRLAAYGWHWAVRAKANGELRFRDRLGREHALRDLVRRRLRRPGQRWKARGWAFKKAGWRELSAVALWAPGQAEPLVLLTDLPPRWEVLARYDRRFWTEPGFRCDKKKGWQWESSQARGLAHQKVMLVAMAWASLVALCQGLQAARARLAELAARPPRARRGGARPALPQPARESLFRLGLHAARDYLHRPIAAPVFCRLPAAAGNSWNADWRQAQAKRFLSHHWSAP